MIKELLSDFSIIPKPIYQPSTFQPYFSTILTIIALTVFFYSLQTLTSTIHAYAANPITYQNAIQQAKNCKNFIKKNLLYLCSEWGRNEKLNYISGPSFSLEQDLHKPTN